jgi:hypothetical protein
MEGIGNMQTALQNWGILFIWVVIPLQLAGALFEAFLFRKLFIKKNTPLPYGLKRGEL